MLPKLLRKVFMMMICLKWMMIRAMDTNFFQFIIAWKIKNLLSMTNKNLPTQS